MTFIELNPGTGIVTQVPDTFVSNSSFQNFKPSNTRRLRKSVAKVRAGTGNSRWLFMGESNTTGNGSGTGANGLIDARKNAYSYQFSKLLNTALPAHEDSFFGIGTAEPSLLGDGRMVFSSGWGYSVSSLGGQGFTNTTNGNAATFTPLNNVDTFKVWFILSNNKTTKMNVTIDGGAPTTGGSVLNSFSAGTSVGTATFTAASSGSHAFALARDVSDANGFVLLGIEAWDSTRSMVSIINAGASGNKASSIALTSPPPYNSLNVATLLVPDVVVILEGQNDATAISGSTGLITDYVTAMTSIINALLPTSDIILGMMGAFDTAIANSASQGAVRQAILSLQAQYDLPMFDPNNLMIDYPTANSDGYMFSQVHENALGYSQWAGLLFNAVRQGVPI